VRVQCGSIVSRRKRNVAGVFAHEFDGEMIVETDNQGTNGFSELEQGVRNPLHKTMSGILGGTVSRNDEEAKARLTQVPHREQSGNEWRGSGGIHRHRRSLSGEDGGNKRLMDTVPYDVGSSSEMIEVYVEMSVEIANYNESRVSRSDVRRLLYSVDDIYQALEDSASSPEGLRFALDGGSVATVTSLAEIDRRFDELKCNEGEVSEVENEGLSRTCCKLSWVGGGRGE